MSLQIKYHREGDVHTIETGNQTMGIIRIDQTGVSQEERAGTAKQLLGLRPCFVIVLPLTAFLKPAGQTIRPLMPRPRLKQGPMLKDLAVSSTYL